MLGQQSFPWHQRLSFAALAQCQSALADMNAKGMLGQQSFPWHQRLSFAALAQW